MTTTIVSHITTKNSTQYSEMKKQGLTHRSATLLLRVPLVFPPFGWKKLKAKSRHCIDIIHIYHINKLSIRNMLNLFI